MPSVFTVQLQSDTVQAARTLLGVAQLPAVTTLYPEVNICQRQPQSTQVRGASIVVIHYTGVRGHCQAHTPLLEARPHIKHLHPSFSIFPSPNPTLTRQPQLLLLSPLPSLLAPPAQLIPPVVQPPAASISTTMPPPPSDQELFDSFTNKEIEFYDWDKETRAERDQLDLLARINHLKARWPSQEDRIDFAKWSRKWHGRHIDRMNYRMSDEEIFEQIRNTNFASSGGLAHHCWAMEMSSNPFIFLGTARHQGKLTGYAVQTSSTFLWPTRDSAQKDYLTKPGLMHRSLLAINPDIPVQMTGFPSPSITTPPSNRAVKYRHGQMTPESSRSDPDQTSNGFVFAQLGELYVFVGDWEAARHKMDDDDDDDCDDYADYDDDCDCDCKDDHDDDVDEGWRPTGFGVVVEVQSNGQPKCLWAIYNCLPPRYDLMDEPCENIDTLRIHRQNEQVESFVFNNPEIQGDKNPCYVVKMTNDLQGLGFSKELDFQVTCRREVQIVRAKSWKDGNGRLVVFPEPVADKK